MLIAIRSTALAATIVLFGFTISACADRNSGRYSQGPRLQESMADDGSGFSGSSMAPGYAAGNDNAGASSQMEGRPHRPNQSNWRGLGIE